MNRVEEAIQNLAHILSALSKETPNRQAVFAQSLTSLVGFAISEHQAAGIEDIHKDLVSVANIQARAARIIQAKPASVTEAQPAPIFIHGQRAG